MEPSDIRRGVIQAVEQARRKAAVHRADADRATEAFHKVLPAAIAIWKQAASVLRAEGYGFTIQTPADLLQLASDRSSEDLVELALDTARRPPAVVVRTRLSRGRRLVDRESVVAEGDAIATLDEERLLGVLVSELEPFVER